MKLSTENTGAIRALLDLAPKTARRLADGSDEEVSLDAIGCVRPGEKKPVDGQAVDGRSSIDEPLTGECHLSLSSAARRSMRAAMLTVSPIAVYSSRGSSPNGRATMSP